MLTAGVGRTNVFAEPVVIHFIDLVDQHEARLREIVGRRHDDVPDSACRQSLVDLARGQTFFIRNVVACLRPLTPDELRFIGDIKAVYFNFLGCYRKCELPVVLVNHCLHKFVGNQQRQIELPQTTVLAFGADELHYIGVTDIEGAHLCSTTTTRRRHCKTHLVVDIHEGQWAGRVCTRACHIGALGP